MKILVVDDHPLTREALRGVVADLSGDAEFFEAADSQEAMALVAEHPDIELVLLDLNLPDRNGFSVLASLREQHPEAAVVVLSGVQDRHSVMRVLDLGASGFIPKTGQRNLLMRALQLVLAGGIYIPQEILARDEAESDSAARFGSPSQPEPVDLRLTARQSEVLALVMQGKSNKAICRLLNLAEPTVKNHMTAILKALKVTNRTEAAISAQRLGWTASMAKTLAAAAQAP